MKALAVPVWPALRNAAAKAAAEVGAKERGGEASRSDAIMRAAKRALFVVAATGGFLALSLLGLGLPAPSVGVAALGGIVLTAWLCGTTSERIWSHPHLFLFAFAPVPERTVFKRMAWPAIRSSWTLVFPVWALIAPLASADWSSGESLLLTGCLSVPATVGLVSTAFVLHATAKAGLFRTAVFRTIFLGAGTGLVPGGRSLILGVLEFAEPLLRYLSPVGWAGQVVRGVPLATMSWLWLVPLALMAGSIVWSLRRTGGIYRFRESFLEAMGASHGAAEDYGIEERPAPRGDVTAVREQVLSGTFLRSQSPEKRSRVDRLIYRLFTPRQRLVADWAFVGPVCHDSTWRNGVIVLAGSLLLGGLVRWMDWPWHLFVWIFGGAVGWGMLSLRTSGGVRAYELNGLGQRIGLHAFQPVHLAELSHLEWKICLGRWLAALVPAVAFGVGIAMITGESLLMGADFGARAIACNLPLALLSQASVISQCVRIGVGWRKCIGFLGVILLMVAGAAAGILGAIAPGVGWLLLLICAACAQGIVSFYMWMAYGPSGSFAAKPTPPFTEG